MVITHKPYVMCISEQLNTCAHTHMNWRGMSTCCPQLLTHWLQATTCTLTACDWHTQWSPTVTDIHFRHSCVAEKILEMDLRLLILLIHSNIGAWHPRSPGSPEHPLLMPSLINKPPWHQDGEPTHTQNISHYAKLPLSQTTFPNRFPWPFSNKPQFMFHLHQKQ